MSRLFLIITFIALVSVACSGDNESAHTTATTIVSPPPRQALRVEKRAANQAPAQPDDPKLKVDPKKPLLVFNLPNGKTFREGEPVVIDFSLANAKLKGDGGEYRVLTSWTMKRCSGLTLTRSLCSPAGRPASTRSASSLSVLMVGLIATGTTTS